MATKHVGMIASVSGIRGIPNSDVSLADFARFSSSFAGSVGAEEVLLARDTRVTGQAIGRAVVAALLSRGVDVVDYGTISTPALFRESRRMAKSAIMVTASHNEPEFNGLKFIMNGMGAGGDVVERSLGETKRTSGAGFGGGIIKRRTKSSYNDDLVERFGASSCEGVRVALDLGGGAAVFHAAPILRGLGCEVLSINDSVGIFGRRVDPMADDLTALKALVKAKRCEIGLGFDCDGDRLCVVDSRGVKRSGDFMLTLALSRALGESGRDNDVVVSQDTTLAIEEVVAKRGGRVFRSKVGEANVVAMMREKGATFGGEGSSGGLVDGSFNYCRDAMLAALLIIKALKREGLKFYGSVKTYHQEREAVQIPRGKAIKVVKSLARSQRGSDTTDGVKLLLSRRSWVLVRPSNTEDVVRVSAEADTAAKAREIVKKYSRKVRELSR